MLSGEDTLLYCLVAIDLFLVIAFGFVYYLLFLKRPALLKKEPNNTKVV